MWFAAGLVLAMVAGILIFISLLRVTSAPKQVEEPQRVPVVVAARDIALHSVIGPEDLVVSDVPPETVPDGVYADPTEVLGLLTTTDLARGEIVLQRRLISPDYVGPRAAFVMDPNRLVVAIPTIDLLSSLGIVRPGDHVDLMITTDFGKMKQNIWTGYNTLMLLQDVEVAAVVYDSAPQPEGTALVPPTAGVRAGPKAFLLAMDPQDALMVKYFRDVGASMDVALRSPAAEGEFEVAPVDGDYVLERFQIRWEAVKGQ